MPYRITVDRNRCEANAVCERIAPEVFQLGSEDELKLLRGEIGDDLVERVRLAADRCPKAALRVEEI